MDEWSAAREVAMLSGAEVEQPGLVFRAGEHLYRTTGERVGSGGMGTAFHLDMVKAGDSTAARAVAKIFRWEYLVQLSKDPEARRHYEHNLRVLERIQLLMDLHLLPILCTQPLRDNHLVVSPFAGDSFVSVVVQDKLSARERVALLLQAVRGLRVLHDQGIVHGDFTLRNVLVQTKSDGRQNATLFDFDLSLALDELAGVSYAQHYDGRIVGSPEYSLTPEQLDPVLEQTPLSVRRDIYGVGTSLFALFTDASVYGDADDLPSLLEVISEGVVRKGKSRVPYPDGVPPPIRTVIDTCLERDPADRYPDASALIRALELAHGSLGDKASGRFTTLAYVQVPRTGIRDIFDQRPDPTVRLDQIREIQATLARHGYLLEKSLGRVKSHPIYLAQPDPVLVATGRFPEVNAYRKIVTAIDFRGRPDAEAFLQEWLGGIVPILEDVRRAFLTALHRVVVDRPTGQLLLFSEYLDDPRFGTDLERHELNLDEALGLGLIIVAQVARLHERGLAHNNVTLRSLLFKRLPDSGQVMPVFVGLVEPSFAPAALGEDVRNLAGMLLGLIRPSRVVEAAPALRPRLADAMNWLDGVSRGLEPTPAIATLAGVLEESLGLIERNFEVVLRHGGDPLAFAYTLTRHSLYRYLWG